MKLERLQREHDLVGGLGISVNYIDTWEALSGFPVRPLRDACAAFLRDTQSMWDDVLPGFLKRGLNLTPGEATRADAVALMRAPEFDAAFSAEAMESAVRRHVTEMGSSPDARGPMRWR